jgi:hypothetical protein
MLLQLIKARIPLSKTLVAARDGAVINSCPEVLAANMAVDISFAAESRGAALVRAGVTVLGCGVRDGLDTAATVGEIGADDLVIVGVDEAFRCVIRSC